MKKGLIVVAIGIVGLATVQWTRLTEDASIEIVPALDMPMAMEGDSNSNLDAPAETAQSPKQTKEVAADTGQIDQEAALNEAARSSAYRRATEDFRSLDASEKKDRRKGALSKVISGSAISVDDEIAMQQSWESIGQAEPGYQHRKDDTKIDVNGTMVDVARPGIVVADSVMVYIPPGKAAFATELGLIDGINNIEPVFKNAKPSTVPGVRDPAGWQKIELSAPASRIKSIVRALKSFEDVTEAEPVYERKLSITGPLVSDLDDPKMGDQWHLDAARVKEAWAFLEENDLPAGGDESIVVAVIDTGVDYNHPDLAANMWVNTQEIPGNGVDDDDNGFVDDIHGAAVVSESFSHSGDPDDDHGHGTHVAGIIASTGANGVGGVGVAFNSKIMAIKAAQYSGVLTTADIAEGIIYAVDNGADVINMSFGGYGRSQVEQDALAIAYSQAVLVAAAGNDGKPNQASCLGAPMYPASHAWVLGVMARKELPNAKGDYLAGFSNRECVSSNGIEYELMAPGAEIWSTLPDNSYSAWSGTSMAAPVVAGMAVLARTRWPDKSTYSSRFIMGQVGATGGNLKAFTPMNRPAVFYAEADAYSALTSTPEPELSYEEHWLFDEIAQGDGNDGDGRVDAGESIELAIAIRNRWGKADNVVVTLSTPSGASAADPHVTFQTASVNYGAVGSFNKDDNGIEYDDGLLVTGVRNPFVLSVDADTPNNHIIPFTLTMNAENGLDPTDATSYSFTSTFQLVVQRGRELPSIIGGDALGTDGGNIDTDGVQDGVVTIDDSALWIIDKPVLIEAGTTLKISEGAQLQFWSSQSENVYSTFRPSYLQVEGVLDIEGSASNMVHLFPSALYSTRGVGIQTEGNGSVSIVYSRLTNLIATGRNFTKVDYNIFDRFYPETSIRHNSAATQESNLLGFSGPALPGLMSLKYYDGTGINYDYLNEGYKYTGNRIYKIGFVSSWGESKPLAQSNYCCIIPTGYNSSLVEVGNFQILGSENYPCVKRGVMQRCRRCWAQIQWVPLKEWNRSHVLGLHRLPTSYPRDWTMLGLGGRLYFNAITGDGWQNIRVAGAVAADNPWLVTGDDSERFRFELITSGVEALTLQAAGLTDQVALSWMQDDFELLHGYNLYRSMSEDGNYTRINSSTINKSITEYADLDVTPGEDHYYYFTVVSDSGESNPSNITMATPVDTILPVVTHQA